MKQFPHENLVSINQLPFADIFVQKENLIQSLS